MTTKAKSKLIECLTLKQTHLTHKDVELAVKLALDRSSHTLLEGGRVEIRGFGSFTLHHRPSRVGRNPQTGASVYVASQSGPHFKPGKEMRDRINKRAAGDDLNFALLCIRA